MLGVTALQSSATSSRRDRALNRCRMRAGRYLAGSRLARDQYRDVGGRDALELIPQPPHGRATSKKHAAGIDLDLDKFGAARWHGGVDGRLLRSADADGMDPPHTRPVPARRYSGSVGSV